MVKSPQDRELEKFKKDLRELVLEKVKGTDLKEWIQYGFYTSQAYLAAISMGRIEWTDNPGHGMRYVRCMFRKSLVETLKNLRDGLAWELPFVGWKPMEFVANMIEPFYQTVKHKEYVDVDGVSVEYWAEVPFEARVMITVAIPSVLYMAVEMVKGTVELNSIM